MSPEQLDRVIAVATQRYRAEQSSQRVTLGDRLRRLIRKGGLR
jgi:hypothetical protein